MLADFPILYVDAIVRRTLVSCLALAVVAVAGALVLNQLLVGAGVVVGLGGATLNHRLFQVSTARHIDSEGHLERKPYAGSVAARLGALTVVAFALLFLVRPMGFGMVGGLIAFQVLLMANALAALLSYHRRELANLGGAGASLAAAPAPVLTRPGPAASGTVAAEEAASQAGGAEEGASGEGAGGLGRLGAEKGGHA
jgi:hypothetical protein